MKRAWLALPFALLGVIALVYWRAPVYVVLVSLLHAIGLGAKPYSNSGIVPRVLEYLGIINVNGRWYAFWSGFGSDIQEFGIFGLIFLTWKRHNCHETHCFRIGRHELTKDGHKTLFCHKHIAGHLDGNREARHRR